MSFRLTNALISALVDQRHEFGAGCLILFEYPQHGAGAHYGVLLFHAAHHHAHVLRFDHHGDTQGAGDLLEAVRLVDDYRGPGVDPGTKSLTYALRFRAPDRTLTAAEATEAKLAGVAAAAERFGARIRE